MRWYAPLNKSNSENEHINCTHMMYVYDTKCDSLLKYVYVNN